MKSPQDDSMEISLIPALILKININGKGIGCRELGTGKESTCRTTLVHDGDFNPRSTPGAMACIGSPCMVLINSDIDITAFEMNPDSGARLMRRRDLIRHPVTPDTK